ncbi:MAG: anaerobic ribonucleoside triphosphate reductase, partial [Selenomonadaceae bacterium]|nr:anaerobic ribonucleoside triphosphate reductase [Selenomonadaceae bacterium]
MAEGVKKSFRRVIREEINRAREFCGVEAAGEVDFDVCTYSQGENPAAVENLTQVVGSAEVARKIYKLACADVEEETHQAMEALIHNFNTL